MCGPQYSLELTGEGKQEGDSLEQENRWDAVRKSQAWMYAGGTMVGLGQEEEVPERLSVAKRFGTALPGRGCFGRQGAPCHQRCVNQTWAPLDWVTPGILCHLKRLTDAEGIKIL